MVNLVMQAVLKQLTANNCQGLSSVTIQLPDSSPLQSLSMTGCRKLKTVYVSAAQLQDLSLDSSPQLVALDLACPSLTALSASRCASLEGMATQFECPKLQQLNLFGCRQLRTEGARAFRCNAKHLRCKLISLEGQTALPRSLDCPSCRRPIPE